MTGFDLPPDGHGIVARLIELETEAIEALQDTIPRPATPATRRRSSTASST